MDRTLTRPTMLPLEKTYAIMLALSLACATSCGPDENNTPGEDMSSNNGQDQGMMPSDMSDNTPDDGGDVDMGDNTPDDGGDVDMGDNTPDDGGDVDMNMMQEGCASAGTACDPMATQPDGFVCVVREGGGVCRNACTPGDAQGCGAQEDCAPIDANSGYCQPNECSDFFSTDCGDGKKCIPVTSKVNQCVSAGAGVDGDECSTEEECDATSLCLLTGMMDPMTGNPIGFCNTIECAPQTGTPACMGANEICSPLNLGGEPLNIGLCQETCPLFEDPQANGCEPNQVCALRAFPAMRNGNGDLYGFCSNPNGNPSNEGDNCDDNTLCSDGLLCVSGTCRATCDPEAAEGASGACDQTDGKALCNELNAGDPPMSIGIGACFESCTPYAGADGNGEGCEANEWCFPRFEFENDGFGQCTAATGAGVEGDACDQASPCGPGLICLAGSCAAICDPDAAAGTPGAADVSCPRADDICTGLSQTGADGMAQPINLGQCQQTCAYDEDRACTDTSLTCVPGELRSGTADTCVAGIPIPEVDLLGDCTAAGLAEFDLCGPNSICLDLSQNFGLQGVLCYDLCRTSEGAFNSGSHPDCRSQSVSCIQAFQSTDFGLCSPQ